MGRELVLAVSFGFIPAFRYYDDYDRYISAEAFMFLV